MNTRLSSITTKAAGLAVAAQAFATAKFAGAQVLTGEELFGGQGSTGSEFATQAGLASGDLTTTIASLIRTAMGFLGIVAVIITLYGGFLWMTAAGNDDKVKQAKKVMVSGLIGLVIVIAAFTLAQFVISQLTTAIAA